MEMLLENGKVLQQILGYEDSVSCMVLYLCIFCEEIVLGRKRY